VEETAAFVAGCGAVRSYIGMAHGFGICLVFKGNFLAKLET
jgi:hypothetical protein